MIDKNKNRPLTSKYSNESHFTFGDQNVSKQSEARVSNFQKKKRPQSYRNISKMSEFMKDSIVPVGQTVKVRYVNVIQNTDKSYEVPKKSFVSNFKGSQQFHDFLQNNGNRLFKPVDQFCQYTDLMKKNSMLLRRGQFNLPLDRQQFSTFKRSHNLTTTSYANTSKYFTGFRSTKNSKFVNTIGLSLSQSIKQKQNIRRQKEQFHYRTQKYIKPVNKTCLGHARQYEELFNKERQNSQRKTLKNAMNRVLTMQVMGKQISEMTQLYS